MPKSYVSINLLDTALLIILLFFSVKGLIRGLVQEVAGLLGVAAGIVLARTFSAQFAPMLTQYGVSPGFAPMLSMALLFVAGILVVGLLAHVLHNMLESAFAGGIDRMLGLLAGLAKASFRRSHRLHRHPAAAGRGRGQAISGASPLMRFIQALAGSLDLHILNCNSARCRRHIKRSPS